MYSNELYPARLALPPVGRFILKGEGFTKACTVRKIQMFQQVIDER